MRLRDFRHSPRLREAVPVGDDPANAGRADPGHQPTDRVRDEQPRRPGGALWRRGAGPARSGGHDRRQGVAGETARPEVPDGDVPGEEERGIRGTGW